MTWNTARTWDTTVLGTSTQSGVNVDYELAVAANAINPSGNSDFGMRGHGAEHGGEITSHDAPTNQAELVIFYGPTPP